jgi:methylmalonyl-CoA decarboxylase subunit alpha
MTERAAAGQLVARPSLRSLVDELHERREQARLGGGEERIARQHDQDKLTARERLALLIDEGTFVELGIHGRPHFSQREMDDKEAPADGVVTGYGKVDGRLVAVAAYDFTVMAGSMRAEGVPPARARARQADPHGVAPGLCGCAHPGGGRLVCLPAPVTSSARR